MLTDLTAVDMLRLRTTPRFDVVAPLYSIQNRVRLRLKAGCNDGEPFPSLVPLWNGANWLEREAYDMFGIVFEGHPDLRRMLLPDDWDEGFPLRKDYPLRGWKEFPVYNTERTVAASARAGPAGSYSQNRARPTSPTSPGIDDATRSDSAERGADVTGTLHDHRRGRRARGWRSPDDRSTWDRSIPARTACCG